MPVFQSPYPPLAPANQTGPTATSGVASTGNTGSSLSAARADHAHAASVDSLRAQPLVATGTTATLDLALYDNFEWVLPTAPIKGEANPIFPDRFAYYVTLTVNYTSPNTNQRPNGKLIFKQPASGQITHQIRIATPAWATGGVKGLTVNASPSYQSLTLVVPNVELHNQYQFYDQIYVVDFRPIWDGSSWTLVFGSISNAGGGGLKLQGGAPYVIGGGGNVVSNLSLETAGGILCNGDFTGNTGNIYAVNTFFLTSDVFRYRSAGGAPTLNVPTPSTGIPTYFFTDHQSNAEWELPNQASIGISFAGKYERPYGYLAVRQPSSGQQVASITFYCLGVTWGASNNIRGVTQLSNPSDPESALTTTLNEPSATIVRDALSPDLNPRQGAGAVTVYEYQYLSNGSGNWFVLIKKRPLLPTATNPAGLTPVPDATEGQVLAVDSTGQPTWTSRLNVDAILQTPTSITYSASRAIDVGIKNDYVISSVLSGNITFTFLNAASGRQGLIALAQDTTGSRTVTFTPPAGWSLYREAGTANLQPSPAPSAVTIYTYSFLNVAGLQMLYIGKMMPTSGAGS